MPHKEVKDAICCTDGVAHDWQWQGGPDERYTCKKCGGYITKARLKGETDAGA